jgi:1-phosphofructokinase
MTSPLEDPVGMIVTLTLNPSLDRTLELPVLERGQVLRAAAAHRDPGGKGVNVTRALLANGFESCAVLPCGGPEGEELARMLAADAVPAAAVPVAGHTRSNITLVERATGTVTKINEPGGALTETEFDGVAAAVLDRVRTADWVVLCGSLPPGLDPATYADLTRRFAAAGARVAVDTSGPALLAALDAEPDLIKPNREELAEAVGRQLPDTADVVAAAEQLRGRGAKTVLVSLGADGAVLVDASGSCMARGPRLAPRSTVGAGDALLAGYLAAGAAGAEALLEAVAWGAAAVRLPGSRMPGSADISRDGIAQVGLAARGAPAR